MCDSIELNFSVALKKKKIWNSKNVYKTKPQCDHFPLFLSRFKQDHEYKSMAVAGE